MKQTKFLVLLAICCLAFFKGSCPKDNEVDIDKINQNYYLSYNEDKLLLYTEAIFTLPSGSEVELTSPSYIKMNGLSLTKALIGSAYYLTVTNVGISSNYQWEYNDNQNRVYRNETNFIGRTISFQTLPDSTQRTTPVNISWNGVIQTDENVKVHVINSTNDSTLVTLEQNVVGATNIQVIFSQYVPATVNKIYLQAIRHYETGIQQKTPNGDGRIKLDYYSKRDSIRFSN
jgi:hypothetical protein